MDASAFLFPKCASTFSFFAPSSSMMNMSTARCLNSLTRTPASIAFSEKPSPLYFTAHRRTRMFSQLVTASCSCRIFEQAHCYALSIQRYSQKLRAVKCQCCSPLGPFTLTFLARTSSLTSSGMSTRRVAMTCFMVTLSGDAFRPSRVERYTWSRQCANCVVRARSGFWSM